MKGDSELAHDAHGIGYPFDVELDLDANLVARLKVHTYFAWPRTPVSVLYDVSEDLVLVNEETLARNGGPTLVRHVHWTFAISRSQSD